METVHLKINSKIYDHVIWLLKQFNAEDVEIISDDFWKVKAEVNESYRRINDSEVESISLEEFEKQTGRQLAEFDKKHKAH